METRDVVTIASMVVALLGGAFGVKLLDKWFDREKQQTEARSTSSQRAFADNEQARTWLQTQLKDRDEELGQLRTSEFALLEKVATLAEQVGRLEERSAAQAAQIVALQKSVEKWHVDYDKLEADRDHYRDGKHEADKALTPAILKASILERDLVARDAEIQHLRGQLSAVTGSREPLEPPT